MNPDKVYFKGLNGIRFFAALAVVFHHIEQFKFDAGYSNIWGVHFVDALGHKAVSIFFTLSGFLITYLLFVEIQKTGTINLKKFYFRRLLRIWPLYYLIGIIAFFVLPTFIVISAGGDYSIDRFGIKLLLYALIVPNIIRIMDSQQVVGAGQAWSIGVEEQFYIIWPILIKFFRKYILQFLLVFIIVKMAILLGLTLAVDYRIFSSPITAFLDKARFFWQLLQIEQMAVGGIGAYLLFYKKEYLLNVIYSRWTEALSYLLLILVFIWDIQFLGSTLLEAIIYTSIILNISTNPRSSLKLENNSLNVLGNISYGIYMYHSACIAIIMTVMIHLNAFENFNLLSNIFIYLATPALTVLISLYSHKYFESYFLKLKQKHTVVKSGQSVEVLK